MEIIIKQPKETCCRSYKTPKGRCFGCVEERMKDPDAEEWK